MRRMTPDLMRPHAPLAALCAAALGLSACAGVDGGSHALAPGAAGAPAPVAGFDWFPQGENAPGGDNEAGLVFGEANTDNIWLGLSCRRGGGRLELLHPAGPGDPAVIRLESGGETESYPARAETSDMHDGADLTATASTRDPVFQRFRQVGWMAILGDGGERALMVPHPQTTPAIERFFAFCG